MCVVCACVQLVLSQAEIAECGTGVRSPSVRNVSVKVLFSLQVIANIANSSENM